MIQIILSQQNTQRHRLRRPESMAGELVIEGQRLVWRKAQGFQVSITKINKSEYNFL